MHVQRLVTDMHERESAAYRRKHPRPEYLPGDRVWVKTLPLNRRKLDPLYTGPCEILDRVGATGRYTVAMPSGPEDVHMERFKPYLEAVDGRKTVFLHFKPHAPLPEDDNQVVERILRHRLKAGKHQWLVRWGDGSPDSWEPASSFLGFVQQDWLRFNRANGIRWDTDVLPSQQTSGGAQQQ